MDRPKQYAEVPVLTERDRIKERVRLLGVWYESARPTMPDWMQEAFFIALDSATTVEHLQIIGELFSQYKQLLTHD